MSTKPSTTSTTQTPTIVWQQVDCPLCHASAEDVLLEVPWDGGDPFRLVRCRSCGMGYLNPRPDEASIGHFYPDEYGPYQAPVRAAGWWRRLTNYLQRLVMARRFGTQPALRGVGERLLSLAAGPWFGPGADSMTALPYHGEGRLLEYGCGSGWYAHRMKQLGWNVTGMDFSEHAAARTSSRFGIPVIVGSLPHPAVKPESFDVVTMGAVLEHVHWPHDVIGAAAKALRPGGYLAISVPNLASWAFRTFGPDWWGLSLPHHLLHFTPETLRRLMEQHGLEVTSLRQLTKPGWMRRSIAGALKRPGGKRGLLKLGKTRLVSGLLTRWAVRSGQGDCLQVIAHKRGTALPPGGYKWPSE